MSCSSLDVIAVARVLRATPGADEATLRSAISRAYYAALHAAGDTFPIDPSSPFRVGEESTHKFVERRVREYATNKSNPLASKAALIAVRLSKGRLERNFADYVLHKNLLPHQVSEMFKRAEIVIELCKQIDSAS